MILFALLLVLILGAMLLRQVGRSGPLNDTEGNYVKLTWVPLLLAIVLPAIMRITLAENRRWIEMASTLGLLVSAAMGLWGIWLVRRAVRKRRAWGWPLGVAVLVAGGPALVVYTTNWLLKLMD